MKSEKIETHSVSMGSKLVSRAFLLALLMTPGCKIEDQCKLGKCNPDSSSGSSSSADKWVGIKQVGAGHFSTTRGRGIAVDFSGNIFLVGQTTHALEGSSLTGSLDFFVTQISSSGTKRWTRQFGVASSTINPNAITVDRAGNVFVVGETFGSFHGSILLGSSDCFIAKLNSSGILQWSFQLGAASGATRCKSVATDSKGNIFVGGSTSAELRDETGDSHSANGVLDGFVAQYGSTGNLVWLRQFGQVATGTESEGVSVDASGNVVVAGYTGASLFSNPLMGNNDFFIAKFNTSGVRQWSRQLGVANKATFGNAVATDSFDQIYVVGYTNGGLDGNTASWAYGTDLFITKYDSLGAKKWTKQMGVSSLVTSAKGVATDTLGNVFVIGETMGDLDGNPRVGSQDAFIIKYNGDGTKLWSRLLGATGLNTTASSVALDPWGSAFMTGSTPAVFDEGVASGSFDNAFVAKYSSAGSRK